MILIAKKESALRSTFDGWCCGSLSSLINKDDDDGSAQFSFHYCRAVLIAARALPAEEWGIWLNDNIIYSWKCQTSHAAVKTAGADLMNGFIANVSESQNTTGAV